jgi:hypothetical protein
MNAVTLITKLLEKTQMHKRRMFAVMEVVASMLTANTYTLCNIGQNIENKSFAKHNIKKVQRLFKNKALHHERNQIYSAISSKFIVSNPQPVILVDWSDLTEGRGFHLLRAAIPCQGRSVTIYEEVHPQSDYMNLQVESTFLDNLQAVIPASCKPIVVTDAGFRAPWCRSVMRKSWSWITRIRGGTNLLIDGKWETLKTLSKHASSIPKNLGQAKINRHSKSVNASIYIYKDPPKGRFNSNNGKKRRQAFRYKCKAKAAQEPWLLSVSLPEGGTHIPEDIIAIYKQRMQIEEGFRDVKCNRYGRGLIHSGIRNAQRLENLLLLAHLSFYLCWLVGICAERENIHLKWQANTRRKRRVHSVYA